MSTIIPSPLSGLSEGVARGLQFREQRQRRELEEELQRERLGLQERQVGVAEQAAALNRVQTMLPLLPGKSVAEVPFLHEDLATLFPGANPADTSPAGMGSFTFTPETIQDVVAPAIIEAVRRGGPEIEDLVDIGVAQAITGEPTTAEERTAQKTTFQFQTEAFNRIAQDPVLMERAIRSAGGIPQEVSLTLPNGEVVNYGSPEEGRLALGFFEAFSRNRLQQLQIGASSRDQRVKAAESLVSVFNDVSPKGAKISLGTGIRIMDAFSDPERMNALLDAEAARKEREGIPVEQLTPVEAAVKLADHGIKGAEGALEEAAREFPEIAPLVERFNVVTDIIQRTEGLEQNVRTRLTNEISEAIFEGTRGEAGTDVRGRFLQLGPPRPRFDAPEAQTDSISIVEQRLPDVPAGGPAGPTDLAPGSAAQPGAPGMFDPQAMQNAETQLMRQRAMEAATALATGQMTVDQIRQQVGNNPGLLRAIIETAQQLRAQGQQNR